MNEPVQAIRCFRECSQTLPSSPYLWLRLAECCLLHNHKPPPSPSASLTNPQISILLRTPRSSSSSQNPTTNTNNNNAQGGMFASTGSSSSAAAATVNSLLSARVVLHVGDEQQGAGGNVRRAKTWSDEGVSVDEGLRACRNCLASLPPQIRLVATHAEEGAKACGWTGTDSQCEYSANEVGDLISTYAMAHLNLASLALVCCDAHIALASCRAVLAVKPVKDSNIISGVDDSIVCVWRFYAHVYAGEANLTLGLPDHALHHLQQAIALPSFEGIDHHVIWVPDLSPPQKIRAQALCGLALAQANKLDLDRAHNTAMQAISLDPSSHALRIVLAYILVRKGLPSQAVSLLRGGIPPPSMP